MAGSLIRAPSRAATTSAGVIHEPPTHPTLGGARYCGAFPVEMPPVGQNRAFGIGELTDLRYGAPPAAFAGTKFSSVYPASSAARISDTVATPPSVTGATRWRVHPSKRAVLHTVPNR